MFNNVFYFRTINKIGGTEQFLYEIAKKYKDYDITICYNEIDHDQYKRLSKLVRCQRIRPDEKIKCKRVFYSYTIDAIDNIEAEECYFISHANYEIINCIPPITEEKITHFIGVSDFASRKLDEWGKKLGREIHTQTCYNPLTLEKVKKPKVIVVACRLNDINKGGERVLKLIRKLDEYCRNTDEHYLMYIFSNKADNIKIDSPNVILMQPRTDIRSFIAMADYVAQLSNDMETYCYTINEALGYGVPVITTPLSILKELPITKNEYIQLEYDCSNIDKVVKEIFNKKVKKFKYNLLKDNWDNILVKGKTTYTKEKTKKVRVKVLYCFTDVEQNRYLDVGQETEMLYPRARELEDKGLVQIQ